MKKLSSSKLGVGDIRKLSVAVIAMDNTDSVILKKSPLPSKESSEENGEMSTLLKKSTKLGLSSLSVELIGKRALLESVIMNEDNIPNTKVDL